MALTDDGNIVTWGIATFGQQNVPPEVQGNAVAIAVGAQHALALTEDGEVVTWGMKDKGQANSPAFDHDQPITEVVAGGYHSLALLDGALVSWGNGAGFGGGAPVPASLTGQSVTGFAAGVDHSLAVTSGGAVSAWGDDRKGQATVPAGLTGKTVTAVAGGYEHSLAIVATPVANTVPAISGSAIVGQTLTVTTGTYNVTPASISYQWLRDDVAIAGATTTSYTLTDADLDADIAVEVTAVKAGYLDGVATSDAVGPVAADIFTAPAASIAGTAKVGQALTAVPAGPYGYRWFRNGAPIAGATGATYLLTADDLDATITLELTASSSGRTASSLSAPVGPVARGAFATGPAASITGTVKVGHTLSAQTGATTPETDRFSYQWFADGAPIAGATGPAHTLTAAEVRAAITVQVTASLTGYEDAVSVSAPTAPVATDQAPELTFSSDVDQLRRGQTTTLRWTTRDADSITRGGGWPIVGEVVGLPLSGAVEIRPLALGERTYLLSATNANGTTTAQVTVRVVRRGKDLTVLAPEARRQGATFRVHARGLAPAEAFTVRFAGEAVAAGRADARGRVTRWITVPMSTPPGRTVVRVVGSGADRNGQDVLRVLRKGR